MFGELGQILDLGELLRRIVKYLVEGLMVAIAAYAIPKRSLNLDEVMLIALTAAATFSILDTYIPSMGVSARSGAGFGLGANLVGFPRM
jgi:ABC-type Co2+ transport system permease subunit